VEKNQCQGLLDLKNLNECEQNIETLSIDIETGGSYAMQQVARFLFSDRTVMDTFRAVYDPNVGG